MNRLRMPILILVLACTGTALAQCPDAIGIWSTTTGTMLGGRASEAWCGADGYPVQPGVPGNSQDARSWNGVALGTQWRAWGMTVDPAGAVLINDTVSASGSGARTYTTAYTGGQFWLSADHVWADGLADLTGLLHAYQVITTITYVAHNPVGATSNITFSGTFANCAEVNDCEITFTIANAMLVWRADSALPMPANFPPYQCGANLGEFFDICCITMQIDCAVPAQDEAWGALKALYR